MTISIKKIKNAANVVIKFGKAINAVIEFITSVTPIVKKTAERR